MSTSRLHACISFPLLLTVPMTWVAPLHTSLGFTVVVQCNLEVSRHCDRNAATKDLFQIIALTLKQPRGNSRRYLVFPSVSQSYQPLAPNSCSGGQGARCLTPSECLISSHNVKIAFMAFCQGSEGPLSVCATCQMAAQRSFQRP